MSSFSVMDWDSDDEKTTDVSTAHVVELGFHHHHQPPRPPPRPVELHAMHQVSKAVSLMSDPCHEAACSEDAVVLAGH